MTQRFTLIFLLIGLASPAMAGRDPAQCAALWYGMVDAAKDYPGYFGDIPATKALAAQFARMAGPDAAKSIAAQRKDFRLVAKAKVLRSDPVSTRLFDQIAESCDTLLK